MVYVLYGTENVLIKEFINNIKEREEVDNIINYNLEDITLEEIIEDASYTSLFNDKKVIVVSNSYFLKDTLDTSVLEKYINSINELTFLVFVLNDETIDNKKKIVKLLKEKCVVKEFNKLSNYKLESLISDKFKEENYKIELNAINELISRCNGDYSLITSEIEKLKLYKLDTKKIDLEDIYKVINRNIEDDIFKLTDAIAEKNRIKIFNIYNDLIENGEDPTYLIGIIASQFRIYKQVRDLIKIDYNETSIDKKLGIHPYRVKLAREKINYFTEEKVNDILTNLYKLDYEIKSGNIDKFVGLELFLISL